MRVQAEGRGVALSSLQPRYHALVFTVDVSQWRGAHSFWPCSVNILEHSGCSGESPGALYLNNINRQARGTHIYVRTFFYYFYFFIYVEIFMPWDL